MQSRQDCFRLFTKLLADQMRYDLSLVDGMPGITRLADGSLLLVFEGHWDYYYHNATEPHRHFSVQARQSTDEGFSYV